MSFPHTRGDVPQCLTPCRMEREFSPHAWGCTVIHSQRAAHSIVFPTRVGMYRPCCGNQGGESRFPHTRGDVPIAMKSRAMPATVFPTRVGMYRRCEWVAGDVFEFSPHAWGCTERRARVGRSDVGFPHTRGDVPALPGHAQLCQHVFPTRVGMYRRAVVVAVPDFKFSPHAWGCTVDGLRATAARPVFPTRVGMYRPQLAVSPPRHEFSPHAWGCTGRCPCGCVRPWRFPHTRGDVPHAKRKKQRSKPFSPHAWGCTAYPNAPAGPGWVFPTRVGMYRRLLSRSRLARRFPHTRGDVPVGAAVDDHTFTFSPHAWGCTVSSPRPTIGYNCFPHTRGDVPAEIAGRA